MILYTAICVALAAFLVGLLLLMLKFWRRNKLGRAIVCSVVWTFLTLGWCEEEYFKGIFILYLIVLQIAVLGRTIFGRGGLPPAVQFRVISRRVVAF